MSIINPPVRVENVVVYSTGSQARDSLRNITVTHKSYFNLRGFSPIWQYRGETDSGMGVYAESYSGDVQDFSRLHWKISAGSHIDIDILNRH